MPQEPYDDAAGLLLFNAGYVYRYLRAESRRLGIRWTALMVLKDLELQGPISQKELAAIEQTSAARISVLMRELEAEGWIRLQADPNDGRAHRVSLTAAGRRRLEADGRRLQESLEGRLRALSPRVVEGVVRAETAVAGLWVNER